MTQYKRIAIDTSKAVFTLRPELTKRPDSTVETVQEVGVLWGCYGTARSL
jgi:hypothetical protein